MAKRKIKVVFTEEEARGLLKQVWTMSTTVENYDAVMGAINKLKDAIEAGEEARA